MFGFSVSGLKMFRQLTMMSCEGDVKEMWTDVCFWCRKRLSDVLSDRC